MNFLRRLFGMKPKQPRSPELRRPTPRPPIPPRPQRTVTLPPPLTPIQPRSQTTKNPRKVFYKFTCKQCYLVKYTSWETYARQGICYTCTDFPKYCECGHGITREEYDKCYSCAIRDGEIVEIG